MYASPIFGVGYYQKKGLPCDPTSAADGPFSNPFKNADIYVCIEEKGSISY
jgi:hypothetical protein